MLPRLTIAAFDALWPAHVHATLADLARRLGHGV
jgi:hypothetical protein